MNQIIIYGSQYGTTKCYAEELSKRTGIVAVSFDNVKDVSCLDRIIYLGGLYAGGVKGLKKTVRLLPADMEPEVIIITVGLSDPTDPKNTDHIRESIKNQVPESVFNRAKIFHLRGGMDYQKLNLLHKIMMAMLRKSVKKLPEEQQTAETKAMLDTYNKKVDFINFSALDEIIEKI